MKIILLGAPASGKGTLTGNIKKEFSAAHISTGDMLRQAIKNQTAVGQKAQEYMDKGALVPDEIIHDIIIERLSKNDINRGFLFDGYPRTEAQAIDLSDILSKLDKKVDAVINLEIEDEELKRLLERNEGIKKLKEGKGITSGELLSIEKELSALRPEITIETIQKTRNTDFLIFLREIIGLTREEDPKELIEKRFDNLYAKLFNKRMILKFFISKHMQFF